MAHLIDDLKKLSPSTLWLLSISLTFNVGSFIVVPFLAVYLHNTLGLSLAFVSVQLTLKLFSQRGLMLVGGLLSDRLGPLWVMGAGAALRIVSFFLYAWSEHEGVISVASLVFGFAGALFVPASKSALSQSVVPAHKPLMFSLRSTANNLGMALGGLIGAALIELDPVVLFAGAAGVQALSSCFLALRPVRALHARTAVLKRERAGPSAPGQVLGMLANPVILKASLLYLIYIALYVQLEFTLPIATANTFSERTVGLLFFFNTATVFLLQVPLNYYLGRRFSLEKMILIGFGCIALAMLGFYHMPSLPPFLALVSLYTVGEIIIDPAIDAVASAQVHDARLGALFGLLGTAALLGGLLGNGIGAVGFVAPTGGVFWLGCAGLALFACVVQCLPTAEWRGARSKSS